MTYQYCTVETKDHVMVVTINRPDRRNALHAPASHELGDIFDTFENNPEYWVAILTGAGDKAFCAGADLRHTEAMVTGDFVPPSGFGGLTSRYDRKKPLIAAVNGFATGGGFELALACDIIIAADTARFGLTEPRVGLAAMGGGIQRLARDIGPRRAAAMLLTGRQVSAAEGLQLGFINEVVPQGELMAATQRWVDEILLCSPNSIATTMTIANAADGQSIRAAMDGMLELPAVKAIFSSPDAQEGPAAFAEHRKPRWSNPTR